MHIENLHAVKDDGWYLRAMAENATTVRSEARGDIYINSGAYREPRAMLSALERLGYRIPAGLHQIAAAGQPITGIRLDVHDLDRKLAKTTMSTRQRMEFKAGLSARGLLR